MTARHEPDVDALRPLLDEDGDGSDDAPPETRIQITGLSPAQIVAAAAAGVVVLAGLVVMAVTGPPPPEAPDHHPEREATASPAAEHPPPDDPIEEPGGEPSPAETAAGRPLLGEPVGLVIVVSGAGEETRLVDLDTGASTELTPSATPRLVERGRLLNQDDWGWWTSIDLSTTDRRPAAQAHQFGAVRFAAAVRAEADGVWFRHHGPAGRQQWSRVDLDTGDVLQEVELPAQAEVPQGRSSQPLTGPEIVGASTGVFALQPDGRYVRILEGRLISFSESLILVADCDDELRCRNRWFDRATLAETDRPAPDEELGSGFIREDRILVAETHVGSGLVVKVFDLETGEPIVSLNAPGIEQAWVSPDGRFLARRGYDSLLISDIERARHTTIHLPGIGPDSELVWGEIEPIET